MPSLSGLLVVLLAALLIVLDGTRAVQECIQSNECMDSFAQDASGVGHVRDAYCREVQDVVKCLRDNEDKCLTPEEKVFNQRQIEEITKRNTAYCDGVLWRGSTLLVLVAVVAGWWLPRLASL